MLVIFSLFTLLEKWWERRERDGGKGEKKEGGREGKEQEERGLDDFFILTCHSQFHASLWVLGGGWRV